MHERAAPQLGEFRTGPRGRAPFTFTSFGDQGTPTLGKRYVPPGGVTIPDPPYVNDNLGSPVAGDTTMGVERVQPLFHLFNGDLCYANLATDRVRTWSDFWEKPAAQRLAQQDQANATAKITSVRPMKEATLAPSKRDATNARDVGDDCGDE